MIAAVSISRAVYPARIPYREFIHRFRILRPDFWHKDVLASQKKRQILDSDMQLKDHAKALVGTIIPYVFPHIAMQPDDATGDDLPPNTELYQFGKTKAFFAVGILEKLEIFRQEAMLELVGCLQTNIRMFVSRSKYVRIKHAALRIQPVVRGYLFRRIYRLVRRSCIVIQSLIRTFRDVRRVQQLRLRRRALQIQCMFRKFMAAKTARDLRLVRISQVRIACAFRSFMSRSQLLRLRNAYSEGLTEMEKREEERHILTVEREVVNCHHCSSDESGIQLADSYVTVDRNTCKSRHNSVNNISGKDDVISLKPQPMKPSAGRYNLVEPVPNDVETVVSGVIGSTPLLSPRGAAAISFTDNVHLHSLISKIAVLESAVLQSREKEDKVREQSFAYCRLLKEKEDEVAFLQKELVETQTQLGVNRQKLEITKNKLVAQITNSDELNERVNELARDLGNLANENRSLRTELDNKTSDNLALRQALKQSQLRLTERIEDAVGSKNSFLSSLFGGKKGPTTERMVELEAELMTAMTKVHLMEDSLRTEKQANMILTQFQNDMARSMGRSNIMNHGEYAKTIVT
jgi:myosin heavy subunit